MNEWRPIVKEIMDRIKEFGLLDNAIIVRNICNYSPESDYQLEEDYKPHPPIDKYSDHVNVRDHYHCGFVEDFEFPTQRMMWDDAQDLKPDTRMLYIHTKGASYPPNRKSRIARHRLSELVINNWKECIAITDIYDSCGPCPRAGIDSRKWPYFRGTFFWARASHIKNRPKPVWDANRYEAEHWILHGIGRYEGNTIVTSDPAANDKTKTSGRKFLYLPNIDRFSDNPWSDTDVKFNLPDSDLKTKNIRR